MISTETTISECRKAILDYLLASLGRENIVSVILTGSAARGQERYKSINGIAVLESDLDLVVVVDDSSILRSLRLIKRISQDLTAYLRKKWILSHVSMSVVTERSITRAQPSIFFHDLSTNGKVLYGKQINGWLTPYAINQIPINDICRLLLNRMTEAIESMIQVKTVEPTDSGWNRVLRTVGKLVFAMIQALLIREGRLVFNGVGVVELQGEIDKVQSRTRNELPDLLELYWKLNDQNSSMLGVQDIEKVWSVVGMKLEDILRELSGKDSANIMLGECFDIDKFPLRRTKLALVVLIQYFGIMSIKDLVSAIYYILKNGPDRIYLDLYELSSMKPSLLLSSTSEDYFQLRQVPENNDFRELRRWRESFQYCLRVWKVVNGV
ncbi:MAG: hypothetical protein ACREBU_04410 [Nitrososphaera sp.]